MYQTFDLYIYTRFPKLLNFFIFISIILNVYTLKKKLIDRKIKHTQGTR